MLDLLGPHGKGGALESHELLQVGKFVIITQLWGSDHIVINEVEDWLFLIFGGFFIVFD